MKFALSAALSAAALLAGCAGTSAVQDPMVRDVAPYTEKPAYEHVMLCDLRHDDLDKCEATLKSLCGDRAVLDLRIRPLREPGTSAESAHHRMLQLQCMP